MNATMDQLALALKQAVQAEIEGQHFYLMAARSTTDERGRKVFEYLAEEELRHATYLKAQYQSIVEHGRLDAQLKIGTKLADLAGGSPIFSDRLKARLGEAHFEMTSLAVGIQLEHSAMQFYRDHAARTTDPTARQFFTELAEWETGHHDALSRQQETLKEDYWHDNSFSPF